MEETRLVVQAISPSVRTRGGFSFGGSDSIQFHLEGTDVHGSVKLVRRLEEFLVLRDYLMNAWPGLPFPAIPAAKLIPEPAARIQVHLQKLVDYISRIPAVATSSEFQMFLRKPSDFLEQRRDKTVDLKEVSIVYQSLYPELGSVNYTDELESEVQEYGEYLDALLNLLVSLRKRVSVVKDAHQCFEQQYVGLLTALKTQGEECHADKEELPEYQILSDWVDTEIWEVQSILDAVKYRNMLKKQRTDLEGKLKKVQAQLTSALAGNLGVVDRLKGDRNQVCNKLNQEANSLQDDHDQLLNLAKYVNLGLLNTHIPAFKQERRIRYRAVVQQFTRFTNKCFSGLMEIIRYKFSDFLEDVG